VNGRHHHYATRVSTPFGASEKGAGPEDETELSDPFGIWCKHDGAVWEIDYFEWPRLKPVYSSTVRDAMAGHPK
jgi:hypothetical protein